MITSLPGWNKKSLRGHANFKSNGRGVAMTRYSSYWLFLKLISKVSNNEKIEIIKK